MFLHKIRNLHFLLQCRQQNLNASITDGGIPSTPSPAPSLTENSGIEQHPVLKLPELKIAIKSESISIPWSLCVSLYNRFLQQHSKSALFIESLISYRYIIFSVTDFWWCHGFNIKFKTSFDFFPCHFSPFSNKWSPRLSQSARAQYDFVAETAFTKFTSAKVCHKIQVCMAEIPGQTRIVGKGELVWKLIPSFLQSTNH